MGDRFTNRYTTIDWPAPANVIAYSTTRDAKLPTTPQEPLWLKQMHGVHAVQADLIKQTQDKPEADASYTTISNTVCVVETADCLPLLITNKTGTEVAAIHAGWRGLASGIIANTVQQLQSAPKDCMVWLGPAIGPQSFEVDIDVLEKFASHGWDLSEGFAPFGKKWLVDMFTLARKNLQQLGFAASDIYGGNLCTYSDPDTFYSYRRSKETGRLVHLIWLK